MSTESLLLIDTGADSTLLEPMDAFELLGGAYFDIDFDRDPSRTISVGIGGYARSVTRLVILSTMSDDGRYIGIVVPIHIAEPIPRTPSETDPGNWHAPSLLGRDVLRYFELHLDYFPQPAVRLWFDEHAQRVWDGE